MAKAKMGRPEKLTPEIQAKIVAYVQAGCYIETAAAAAGINKTTLYAWLKKGAAQAGMYRDFSNAVEKAMAESEILDVDRIGKAAKEQWQAAAWRLERRFPDRWGRKEKHEHSGPGGGPIQSRETTVIEVKKAIAAAVADAGDQPSEEY